MNTCRNCKKGFPAYPVIDGRRRNCRKRIYCFDCSPFGRNNRKVLEHQKEGLKRCPKCKKFEPLSNFYNGTKGTSIYCIPCSSVEHKTRQLRFKQTCVDFMGGKCVNCGYSKCLASLDFHHRDPSSKDLNISDFNHSQFDEHVKDELAKCILLCSNCHRETHSIDTVKALPALRVFLEMNPWIKYPLQESNL